MNVDLNKPRLLTRETLAAFVFAAAGFYWLYCGSWFLGTTGVIIGICLGFMYKGLGFDLIAKRYRSYTGLFGMRIGNWETLPREIVGVTLKYFSEIVTSGKPGRIRQDKVGHYVLMLSVYQSPNGIILQRFGLNEKEYAIEVGEEIAGTWQVPLTVFL